ncbi:MAG: methyl-accepting chemotaxis protein [Bacteriovorax sp.]|nr:methyl-accepting chemotaxis protein [Bacteriovorax sp.]
MKKWFSGIRARLLLVSVLSVVSLLIVGITGFFAVSSLADKLDVAYNQRLKLSQELSNIESGIHAVFRYEWVALSDDKIEDRKERQQFLEKVKDKIVAVDTAVKNYAAIKKSPEAQEVLVQKLLPNWEITKKALEEVTLELNKNDSSSNDKAKVLIKTKQRNAAVPVAEAVAWLQDKALSTNKKIVEESLSYAHNAKTFSLVVVLLAGILSFTICIYIANQLVKILSTLSNDLNSSSMEVSAAAEQIASASEQLSQANVEQASSLEETSSSIQEMSSMVSKTSENAIQASRVSGQSQENALKGKEVVQNMISSINEITDSNNDIMNQINQSNKEISEIVKVIAEIGDKTKVINDIVFQTKLLSFNASVEAARAGEHGKGFAVVAEEVGNLAQMSGKAASEITEMLDGSIKKVERIVNDSKTKVERLVREGKSKVDKGTGIARECGVVLEDIVSDISSVSEMANEIAVSSQEQSQGISEITKAMNQINVATQQNAAGATQSASAAEELSGQASMLKNAVHSLMVTIEG